MKRRLNLKEMRNWMNAVGGIKAAADIIEAELECSRSKAEKLAASRYGREMTASEQKVLAALMGRERDVVFEPAGKRASRAS